MHKQPEPRLHAITRRFLKAFEAHGELTNGALADALGMGRKDCRCLLTRYTERGLVEATGVVIRREKVRRLTPLGVQLLTARRKKRPPTKAQREGRARPVANSIFSPHAVGLNVSNFKRNV